MNESTTDEKAPAEADPGFKVTDKRQSHSQEESVEESTDGPSEPALDFSKFTASDVEKLYRERESLSEELEKKRVRLNELARGVQDLQHELDTRATRMEREQEKLVGMAKGQLLSKLLNVLDSFKHSLDSIPGTEQTQPILDGVHMIYRQFLVELGDLGLQSYNPMGLRFNPVRHSALRKQEVEEQAQDGIIIEVTRPGYSHDNRVLRPAEVVVGVYHAPADTTESEDSEDSDSENQAST
jgi:molecular chaperone GrpE